MHPLGFDGFLSDIATVIAEHIGDDGAADARETAPSATAEAEPASAPLPHAFVLDHEKIAWAFPDIAARIIEETP
jgi:hypothetical protein